MFHRYRTFYIVALLTGWILIAQGCGGVASQEAFDLPVKVKVPLVQFSIERVRVVSGSTCPSGARFVTHIEQLTHARAICQKLGPWDIVRLAEGGSADGKGYGCKSRGSDERDLGGSLCVGEAQAGYQCFWMENFSGKYAWVPAPRGLYRGHGKSWCRALDSCNGGGGRSGGGCYKWSKGPTGPRQAWD